MAPSAARPLTSLSRRLVRLQAHEAAEQRVEAGAIAGTTRCTAGVAQGRRDAG